MKRTAIAAVVGTLLAAGCASDPTATVMLAQGLLPAADPKLDGFSGWNVAFDLVNDGFDALDCHVTLSRDAAPVRALVAAADLEAGRCAVSWDGRDENGAFVAPGVVDIAVDVAPPVEGEAELEIAATAFARIEVVRLGIASVDLVGDGRTPLIYGAMDDVERGYYPIPTDRPVWRIGPAAAEDSAAVRIELADGTPRPLPEPWDDLRSPPLDPQTDDGTEQDNYSLPVAFVAGAPIEVVAELNADVAGAPGSGAPVTTEIRVVPPGGSAAVGDVAFAAGERVTVALDPSPVDAVGRYDLVLEWSFEARTPGGEWMPVPGSIATVHRIYGVVAQPTFAYQGEQYGPWVEIVDAVAEWIDGKTADPDGVAAALVEGVYYRLDLVYDRESGASAYTWYPGWGYEDAQFDLSAFQLRGDGNVINCSDAGSILSTYANMVGFDFRYHILTKSGGSFDLNYIKAIGWDEFDETPFFGDRGAFRYHAVVGPADGSFYDATLALDGDGDPLNPPFEELLATGMVPDDYLFDLSSEWDSINISQDQQVEVR